MIRINEDNEIQTLILGDDGVFPNNERLCLIVYRQVIDINGCGPEAFEDTFKKNNWGNSWRNGIYSFHHYHSTAHEVLGVYRGNARVQLGGPDGEIVEVMAGDIVLIPAGVAHKNLGASPDFRVVGAYPVGQSWDMNYGKAEERPGTDRNIERVPLPSKDPVFGNSGPVIDSWHR